MEKKETNRGFGYYEFQDTYGLKCSLQESSSAMEPKIWLGPDDANPQIMASDAPKYGIFLENNVGWVPYPIPSEVLLHTRMHLNQEQAKELIDRLQYFVDNGHL
jgi:endoglucanase Acf2